MELGGHLDGLAAIDRPGRRRYNPRLRSRSPVFKLDSGNCPVIAAKSHFSSEVLSDKVCDEIQTHIIMLLIKDGLRIARSIVSILEQDLAVISLDTN